MNHLVMQPRVKSAIDRLSYLRSHIDRFETPALPIFICLLKLIVEVFVEIMQMSTIFFINDVLWMIMCFAAFTGISCIDGEYYASIKSPLKDKFEATNIELPIENERVLRNTSSTKKGSKFFGGFMLLLIFFYEVVYFHFMPYTAFMYKYVPVLLK